MGPQIVVIDTNVLISACLTNGPPSKIFQLLLENKLSLVLSHAQFDELRRVLWYPHIRITEHARQTLLSALRTSALIITPTTIIRAVSHDPSDDVLLETAFDGKVPFIITGDKHLLQLRRVCNITILTPTEFLTLWQTTLHHTV